MPVRTFLSYSHQDEALLRQLMKHLKPLEYQGIVQAWHDRRIAAGTMFDNEIDRELDQADLILLLISPDFVSSEYCWGKELARAMARHEGGEARVIPVILRPVDWRGSPFGKLLALPTDGRPITTWPDQDEAFLDVVRGIRASIEKWNGGPPLAEPAPHSPPTDRRTNTPKDGHPPFSSTELRAANATIHLHRAARYSDKMRAYKVIMDGSEVGEVRDNSAIEFDLSPGLHKIRVTVDWVGSNVLDVEARPGERIYLECHNDTNFNPLKTMWASTVKRDSYIQLKRVSRDSVGR
jgi:hypothetical protein